VLKDRVQTCDAVMLCVDLTENHDQTKLDQFIETVLTKLGLRREQLLVVGTKSDLVSRESIGIKVDAVVSIDKPESIRLLRQRIQELVELQGQQQFTLATHHTAVRCSHALRRASDGLSQALSALVSGAGEELIASELHFVLDELASIIGEVHNDDILGEIFSRFCIGK
jgi:tRNA U34 5-carboxymethylaminomethyl modifying GTPase MnmE/TrmE